MSIEKKLNIAQNNHFSVVFNKIPNLSQMIQNVTMPSLTIQTGEVPYLGAKIKASTSAIRFGTIVITFRVDENHTIMHEIYNWMGLMHNMDNLGVVQNERLLKDYKEDLMVVYNNNNFEPAFEYNYVGCVPMSLDFEASNRGVSETFLGTLTLEFDYLQIKPLKTD